MSRAVQIQRPPKARAKLKQIDEWRVLDRRVVGIHDGRMLVWLLVVEDDGTTNWKPYYLAEDGTTVLEEPVFCPLPGSQYVFLSSPIFETAYFGNRGGGKCVDEGEVLTPEGWRDIRTMEVGDLVYTFDADGEMMPTVVESVHSEDYDGDLIQREDAGLYMSFTPSHKLPLAWPNGQNMLVPFDQMKGQGDVLRSIVRWEGRARIPEVAAEALGWWLACGTYKNGKPSIKVSSRSVGIAWNASGVTAVDFDRASRYSRVPRDILDGTPDMLRQFLAAFVAGAGIWRKPSVEAVIRTASRGLADDICEVGVKLGFNVNMKVSTYGAGGKREFITVTFTPGRPTRLYTGRGEGGFCNVDRVPFKGKVYCIGVPLTHTFIIRQRGCVWLSGNSDSLLLDFASGVGKGYGKGWRGVLFRKEFGDLDDIVRKVETIFPKIYGEENFRFLKSKSEYTAVWKTGEALLLRNLPNEDAYREYHGHSYAWIGFEELTQWPDDKAYRLMFSCARSPAAGVPVRGIRSTSNPYGIGHNWVKKRFRLPQGFGKVIRLPREAPRVAIQSDLRENFVLLHTNPNYPNLIRQAASNPAQEKAWIDGDWNVTTGGMFDDLWDTRTHIIPSVHPSSIPLGWKLNRSYDHGSAKPFCVLWWAESNGEPAHLPDGRVIGQVPGDLLLFAEWYGTTGEPDVGVRMTASKIAQGILDRQRDWRISHRVRVGPADANIYAKETTQGTNRSPADDMEAAGVLWTPADMSSGSRKRGYQMIRARLSASRPNVDGTREFPGLFVCERCLHWLELVPSAPRSTEDQDELPKKYEDHPVDATRYRVSHGETETWQRGF